MTDKILSNRLHSHFSDLKFDIDIFRGDLTITVPMKRMVEVLTFLKEDPELQFGFLVDLTCIDNLDRDIAPRFELIYLLHSFRLGYRFRLRAPIPGDSQDDVPTATGIWPAAGFPEREIFDLFGLKFPDHPNLKRILMPSWTEGHPLRKDYPLEGLGERETFDSEPE
ncbi:NADH-quinone oxidoreductase subunit C [candidate division KSB1 bacterium]